MAEIRATGKVVASFYSIKPGLESQVKQQLGGKESYIIQLGIPITTNYYATATPTAISKTSKNPERAMMFLNLLNSDKALTNVLFFGIEGKHYKKVGENRIELIDKPAYQSYQWCLGNQFNAFLFPEQKDNVWEETKEMNKKAQPVPVPSPISEEEYYPPAGPVQASFFIAPQGDDANPGTETFPFKTIEKARDTIRGINGNMTGNIMVYIKAGDYDVDSTIKFNESDSGTNGFYIIYKNWDDIGSAAFSGGKRILNWTEEARQEMEPLIIVTGWKALMIL